MYSFQSGNVVLMITFLILILMSMVSWYVIILKILFLKSEKRFLSALKTKVHQNAEQLSSDIIANSDVSINSCASILMHQARLINAMNVTIEDRPKISSIYMMQALDLIKLQFDKHLTILASIGSSAPFVGLFGTVCGVCAALTKISSEGNAGIDVVAGPMGEALIATAVGLFAAIPAVLAYNTFVRFNRLALQEFRHLAEIIEIKTLKSK